MKSLTMLDPLIIPPGEGIVWSVLGEKITAKVLSEASAGQLATVEELSPPQGGPPLHIHRREDELFRVLEGRYEFQVGDRKIIGEVGTTAFLPRNIPHCFKNIADTPSRLQITLIPGGFEGFFAEVSRLTEQGPFELEDLLLIANKYDLEFLA